MQRRYRIADLTRTRKNLAKVAACRPEQDKLGSTGRRQLHNCSKCPTEEWRLVDCFPRRGWAPGARRNSNRTYHGRGGLFNDAKAKAIRWQQPRPLVSSCPSQVMCPNPLPHCCPAALLSPAPRLLAVAVPERKPRCRQLRPGLTFSMYRRAAGSARQVVQSSMQCLCGQMWAGPFIDITGFDEGGRPPVQGLWSALDGGGHGAPFPGEMGAWDSTKMSCGLLDCAEAVWWLRPGDYLIHKAPEDNYFIKATEYQANYRELGTWKADLADLDRFGVILPRSALLLAAVAFFPAHATLTWHHAKTCFCRRASSVSLGVRWGDWVIPRETPVGCEAYFLKLFLAPQASAEDTRGVLSDARTSMINMVHAHHGPDAMNYTRTGRKVTTNNNRKETAWLEGVRLAGSRRYAHALVPPTCPPMHSLRHTLLHVFAFNLFTRHACHAPHVSWLFVHQLSIRTQFWGNDEGPKKYIASCLPGAAKKAAVLSRTLAWRPARELFLGASWGTWLAPHARQERDEHKAESSCDCFDWTHCLVQYGAVLLVM